MRKNNITLSFKNIISFLNNLTSHFTGKEKIITLSLIVLMLSFVNIILCLSNSFSSSVSALSYESNVGIGFSFNPTLSISFSSSDLVIPNLTPGTTSDSNDIVVSVSTNAAYGYTLSTNVGSNDITSPYYGSSDLVHSNNSNNGSNSSNHVFSSIAIDANYSNLSDFSTNADINTWGYSTSLDNGTTWSSYNGLSTSTNTTLVDSNDMTSSAIDFKIAAKASDNQTSGVYSNVINFMAVSKVAPTSLLDAFIASGAEQYNGYFKMQDMTHDICKNVDIEESELQLIDVRDNKIYWVAKLKDGNCWMTQNLDLDLSHDKPLTSNDTDLIDHSLSGAYVENYSHNTETSVTVWTPANTTKNHDTGTGTAWRGSYNLAYSVDVGEWYWDGNDSTPNCNYLTTICEHFSKTSFDNEHLSVGNYYNWSAAIASDNSSSLTYNNTNANNSICPKGWRLPNISNNEFHNLGNLYNDVSSDAGWIKAPLWFVRAGFFPNNPFWAGSSALYWSSTVYGGGYAYGLYFDKDSVDPAYIHLSYGRGDGKTVRCLAR